MELAYVAHSARCALLLDADGICRWFLLKDDDARIAATAKRCVGAQFVATLDPEATGLLGHEPAVGKNVLFARVDDGRVTLVRFGPLVQFDTLGGAGARRPRSRRPKRSPLRSRPRSPPSPRRPTRSPRPRTPRPPSERPSSP